MATENLAPQMVSRLLGEIRQLVRHPPEGVQYIESDENSVSEVHALITGPEGTPFVGGSFRIKLVISSDYPNSPPKGYFLTKIFHPNVANNGDICVNTLKKDWTPEVTLTHVLQVIRCLLIVPFPESSLNDEAGKMFMESYDEYAARAKIVTEVHAMPNTKASADGEDVMPSSENAQKKKEKDAKKKSLKRL
jgi:ubiquitin-conjugating enzyme E2 S